MPTSPDDDAAHDRAAVDRAALDHAAIDRAALDPAAIDRAALDPVAVDRAALDHVVRNLFDGELERLAFARADSPAEQARAAAAAAELARRTADLPTRSGDVSPDAPLLQRGDRAPGAPAPVAPGTLGRRRPRAALVVSGIAALVIAATSVAPLLASDPDTASSLDVFARAATPAEVALGEQLRREGLRLSVDPRVIAERDGAAVIAYRFIVGSGAEQPRNEVCVLLDDAHALGPPRCVERDDFAREGVLAPLDGALRTIVVRWGPSGPPDLSVLPARSDAVDPPRSAAAARLLNGDPGADASADPSADDREYAALLRAQYPDDRLVLRLLARTDRWDAVGALVAAAGSGRWTYCVHLVARGGIDSAATDGSVTCAVAEAFEREGLIAQARTAGSTVLVEWSPSDAVRIEETPDS
ncbi:hypothetical protein [Microcella humidisoli]|uniref:Uncharacterized protein n=1 Tax=Microcella humidisoli TaxID=2963406 RepID=A0ABY5FVD7_9MICO|nr:hypothetical protein [Microcella humidisoli]UTT62104.1 hypothetical protein NNL39_10590 [Microcella humidisoli]